MQGFGSLLRSLERLSSTRINGWLGLASDIGVSVGLLWVGVRLMDFRPGWTLSVLSAGAFTFSLVEYCLHRWLFHGSVPIFEQGHRRHHDRPVGDDSLPFFFAPLAILALAQVLGLIVPQAFALVFTGGFAAGYAAYGLSHTIIHRMRFHNAVLQRWAATHHVHHYHPDCNFGVTTPFWDLVLRTRYDRRDPKAASRS
jgi:sterol desaturase/sphingolipid hydroxylase (fatty acid hydroxylase superfamily)